MVVMRSVPDGLPVASEVLLERAHLPAHRRLAHVERLAGMGEGPGLGGGVEDAKLVPVHGPLLRRPEPSLYSAASAIPEASAARKRSASSAAMQPCPAAVTAWRKTSSVTSPAAKTPGMLVTVESGAVQT